MPFGVKEFLFRDVGLYALGVEITLHDAFSGRFPMENLVNSEGEVELGRTLNKFFPIDQLVNVRWIRCLAQDVEKRYPELVEVAENLLKPLEVSNNEPREMYHCQAMCYFWRNEGFRGLMREHLVKDPQLLLMVAMFSNRFFDEIAVHQLQRITRCDDFLSFKGGARFEMNEPVDRIRCAISIMRYWSCMGVAARLKNLLFLDDGYATIKYADKFHCERIGKVLYTPVENDDPADWNEANLTPINGVLGKVWRDVLTCRYSSDEAQIKSLLGKTFHCF